MQKIESYCLTDKGLKREINEDSVGSHEPQDATQIKKSGCLYVVADGLGGHEYGEKASALAVETLLKVYFEAPDIVPEKRLRDIIQQVNQSLISFTKKNLQDGQKTATTVVAAVVRKNSLMAANVGDSRAYLIRDGKIRQVTNDHSLVGELVRAGTISEVEAQESKFKNRLSRSVGSDPKLEVELYPPIPLRQGDIILLCTDGLTQYATAQILLEAVSRGTSKEIAERLIRFAKSKGGTDNITAAVIKYGKRSNLIGSKKFKLVTLALLGLLSLAAISVLGWYIFTGPTGLYKQTATPTASPSITSTLTATVTPTFTSTPTVTETPLLPGELTQTQTASSMPDATLTPEIIDTRTINPLPNCEYVVKAGDIANNIAATFQTTIEQIFRQDDTQQNMNEIKADEILIIKNISPEVCANGGGVVSTQAPAIP